MRDRKKLKKPFSHRNCKKHLKNDYKKFLKKKDKYYFKTDIDVRRAKLLKAIFRNNMLQVRNRNKMPANEVIIEEEKPPLPEISEEKREAVTKVTEVTVSTKKRCCTILQFYFISKQFDPFY